MAVNKPSLSKTESGSLYVVSVISTSSSSANSELLDVKLVRTTTRMITCKMTTRERLAMIIQGILDVRGDAEAELLLLLG